MEQMRMRDLGYMKPPKFKHYLTLSELCREVNRDPSWIRKLEADGKIPAARRVTRGQLEIRLWSPEQLDEIVDILSEMRPGRPANA
jgi:hypothetical protein